MSRPGGGRLQRGPKEEVLKVFEPNLTESLSSETATVIL